MNVGNISVTVVVGGSITLGLAWWGIKKFGLSFRWRSGKRLFGASAGSGKQDPGSVDASANTVKGNMRAKAAAESGRFNDNKIDGDFDVDFRGK
jgi:hypothetical protein